MEPRRVCTYFEYHTSNNIHISGLLIHSAFTAISTRERICQYLISTAWGILWTEKVVWPVDIDAWHCLTTWDIVGNNAIASNLGYVVVAPNLKNFLVVLSLGNVVVKSGKCHCQIWEVLLPSLGNIIANSEKYCCRVWEMLSPSVGNVFAKSRKYHPRVWKMLLPSLRNVIAKLGKCC